MTEPLVHTPKNRLAKVLGNDEAPLAEQLIADANGKVASLAEAVRGHVRKALDHILTYVGREDEALFAASHALGAAALSVAEVAGAAGMTAIGEIARGVSALVDDGVLRGNLRADALRLHLDALALVSRDGDGRGPDNDIVVIRLAALRKAIGVAA